MNIKIRPLRNKRNYSVKDQIYDWSIGHEFVFDELGIIADVGDTVQLMEEYKVTRLEFSDGLDTTSIALEFRKDIFVREFIYCGEREQ